MSLGVTFGVCDEDGDEDDCTRCLFGLLLTPLFEDDDEEEAEEVDGDRLSRLAFIRSIRLATTALGSTIEPAAMFLEDANTGATNQPIPTLIHAPNFQSGIIIVLKT
jgi:hypothetical protein